MYNIYMMVPARAISKTDRAKEGSGRIKEVIYLPSALSLIAFNGAENCEEDSHMCASLCDNGK
jgi:hypothetical protein